MTPEEQVAHFSNDIDALVERYRKEYEITYAATVGVLQMKIHLLCEEAKERSEEE